MDEPREPVRVRRRFGVLVLSIGLVALVAAAAAVWDGHVVLFRQQPGSSKMLEHAAPPVGRPASDFTLPLFSGGTLSLHSLKGKPILLNFWASWCVPCRGETPLLVRLYKIYGPRGIVFVGVDVEDEERAARQFLNAYHVDYPVVLASGQAVMTAYAVVGIPTTVFIGPNGVVVDRVTGAFLGANGEHALMTRLDHLLGMATR